MADNKKPSTPIKPGEGATPPAPATEQDKRIADKLAQLEKAIAETQELNRKMQEQEKAFDEKMKNLKPISELPAGERQHVIELHKSKADRTKEALKKQDKVKIFVPLEGKEKKGTQLPVTINGYRVNVPKGMYVEVPEQIGQIVMESLNQTQEATDIPQNLDNMDAEKRDKIFS